ncbi:MAG: DNA recombination protein RmuC [Victivallaceae bacterium]
MDIFWVVFAAAAILLQLLIIVMLLKNNSGVTRETGTRLAALPEMLHLQGKAVLDELERHRGELRQSLSENRSEVGASFKTLSDSTAQTLSGFTAKTDERFQLLNTSTENRLNAIRDTLDAKLQLLRDENAKKLEEMRKVVDEKLQETVEKRFNASFKIISENLEKVQKGLGEMQTLATGVGDLKRVLTNVKTRGNLGEIQLEALLEQSLTCEQYVVNAQVKPNTTERVEFAIKLPGKDPDSSAVLLPVDSKFPVDDYQRLLDGYDAAPPPEELKKIVTGFVNSVTRCASEINKKYLNPPVTTDFAVMFVPTEGLYAEILRQPGLFERIQRDFKVTVVGPANLMAFLNSLQMGFRTLAIERRSSEVWNLLSAVKTEFGKFGDVLEKTRSHLESAVKDIDAAGVRTRAIERKLREVAVLPAAEAADLIDE